MILVPSADFNAVHRQESRSSAGYPKNKKAASRKTGRRLLRGTTRIDGIRPSAPFAL
jgi:hypothetical protein